MSVHILISKKAKREYQILKKSDFEKWSEKQREKYLLVDVGHPAYLRNKIGQLTKFCKNGTT